MCKFSIKTMETKLQTPWVQGGSVLLNIGYHQLEGKKLPLKKPLAVLEREPGATQGLSYKVNSHK